MKRFIQAMVCLLFAASLSASTMKTALFTAAGSDISINAVGSGIAEHRLTWYVTGTVSACSVKLQQSVDGTTWSDLIGAQTCTANGATAWAYNVAANYVRITMASYTGTGSVYVTYEGLGASGPNQFYQPNAFHCTVVNSSATILTAFGGQCVAPVGTGLSLYITDIVASASVIATTTADQYLELKSGTGGTCGTGTAVVWASYNTAFGYVPYSPRTPIKVAANSELCWMDAAVGSKTFIVDGFIAP